MDTEIVAKTEKFQHVCNAQLQINSEIEVVSILKRALIARTDLYRRFYQKPRVFDLFARNSKLSPLIFNIAVSTELNKFQQRFSDKTLTGNLAHDYMMSARKRKGLSTDEQIVISGEKQRTLKKNK